MPPQDSLQEGPTTTQKTSKTAREAPETAREAPKAAPRRCPNGRSEQTRRTLGLGGSAETQQAPKRPQGALKRPAKKPHFAPKKPPRGPQETPTRLSASFETASRHLHSQAKIIAVKLSLGHAYTRPGLRARRCVSTIVTLRSKNASTGTPVTRPYRALTAAVLHGTSEKYCAGNY